MENSLSVTEATLGEGRVQIHQLFTSVRFEVGHDRKEELGHAGGHSVELSGVEKSHEGIIRAGGPL